MSPSWLIALQLITRYGIPAAHQIWATAKNSNEPTDADWERLKAIAQKSYQEYIDEAIARATGGSGDGQPEQ